jgi:hypothetical protein
VTENGCDLMKATRLGTSCRFAGESQEQYQDATVVLVRATFADDDRVKSHYGNLFELGRLDGIPGASISVCSRLAVLPGNRPFRGTVHRIQLRCRAKKAGVSTRDRSHSRNHGRATSGGGRYSGVVFKVDPTGQEKVLYTFTVSVNKKETNQ